MSTTYTNELITTGEANSLKDIIQYYGDNIESAFTQLSNGLLYGISDYYQRLAIIETGVRTQI